jgi:hypothetical protein
MQSDKINIKKIHVHKNLKMSLVVRIENIEQSEDR